MIFHIESLKKSEEEIVQLCKENKREEVIHALLGHAINIAIKYSSRANREYLIAEGVFALVKVVGQICDKIIETGEVKDRYIGLIIVCISGACIDYLLRDNIFNRRFKPGKKPNFSKLEFMNGHTPTYDPSQLRELKEIAFSSARNDIEKQILQLRIEGYTDLEIAEKLEITNCDVGRMRARIGRRFRLKINCKEN